MESHLKTLTYVKTHFTPKVPCLYPLKNDAGVKWVNLRNQCNAKHLRKRDVIRSVYSCLWTEAVTWSLFWKCVLKNFALILKNVGSFKSGILIKKKILRTLILLKTSGLFLLFELYTELQEAICKKPPLENNIVPLYLIYTELQSSV